MGYMEPTDLMNISDMLLPGFRAERSLITGLKLSCSSFCFFFFLPVFLNNVEEQLGRNSFGLRTLRVLR